MKSHTSGLTTTERTNACTSDFRMIESTKARSSGLTATGPTKPRILGFTMIELMVALAIVATLTIIAVPAYQSYMTQSRRSVATVELGQILAQAEQYYMQNNYSYPSNLAAAYPTGAPSSPYFTFSLCSCAGCTISNNGHSYTPCTTCVSNCVVAYAATQGSQSSDTTCALMWIDSQGNRASYNTAGTSTTATCWPQ
jgi:type IV pilus assembly protein PilE